MYGQTRLCAVTSMHYSRFDGVDLPVHSDASLSAVTGNSTQLN